MAKNDLNFYIEYDEFIKDVIKTYSHYSKFCAIISPNGTKPRRKNAYLIAEHNGWLERVKIDIENNHKKQKENEYEEFKKTVKRKYKTYNELCKDIKSREFFQLRYNKWHKRIKEDVFSDYKERKESGYWNNFKHCLEESKKYKTRKDFANYAGGAYYHSCKNFYDKEKSIKWIDVMIPPHNMENKIGNVYYYLFKDITIENKKGAIYVGITINPQKRDSSHRNGNNSSVYNFAKKFSLEIPKMKFFEQNISVQESRRLESEYIEKNKNKYYIINKAKCGEHSSSVGAYNSNDLSFYSYEQLLNRIKNVKKYKTYEEFLGDKNNWTDEYKKAFYSCYIRQICKDCGFTPGHYYYNNNLDLFIEHVKQKYNTYKSFRYKGNDTRHNTNEWITAMRHNKEGWLLKTVETLFKENIEETKKFLNNSKSKYLQ